MGTFVGSMAMACCAGFFLGLVLASERERAKQTNWLCLVMSVFIALVLFSKIAGGE